VAQAMVRIPALLLNGLSILRFQIWAAGLTTALAIALKVLLVPDLGTAAILWGTTATVFLISTPTYLLRLERWNSKLDRLPAKGELAAQEIPPLLL